MGTMIFRFLRYLCFFCVARLIFHTVRTNHKGKPAPPCRHGLGVLATLLMLPFVGSGLLILLGFILR
jgi:hypothetical protein